MFVPECEFSILENSCRRSPGVPQPAHPKNLSTIASSARSKLLAPKDTGGCCKWNEVYLSAKDSQ